MALDPAVVGLSEGTTCYVTGAYFENPEPFSTRVGKRLRVLEKLDNVLGGAESH